MSAASFSLMLALLTQFEDAEPMPVEAPPAETTSAETITLEDLGIEEGETPEPRNYQEINEEMRETMRAEALSETLEQRAVHIRKLCALHVELVTDPRYADSDYLKRLRGLIYSRLIRVKDDLEDDIERQQAAAPAGVAPAPEDEPTTDDESPAPSPGETAEAETSEPAGAQGGGVADDGEALVELIETVISPDSWEVNGGNGSIVYWANGHALVVRASGEVHHQMGGLLEGLRRAGN